VTADIAAQIAGADSRAVAFDEEFTKVLQFFQGDPGSVDGSQCGRKVLVGFGAKASIFQGDRRLLQAIYLIRLKKHIVSINIINTY
jgi:hypothetical protein